ncbi:hypothetical protein DFH27DRAFT_340248 [Peziza echinospora]|nr:hypothetical protein DFH27DRAFT_340248 [Peziza echinospora]
MVLLFRVDIKRKLASLPLFPHHFVLHQASRKLEGNHGKTPPSMRLPIPVDGPPAARWVWQIACQTYAREVLLADSIAPTGAPCPPPEGPGCGGCGSCVNLTNVCARGMAPWNRNGNSRDRGRPRRCESGCWARRVQSRCEFSAFMDVVPMHGPLLTSHREQSPRQPMIASFARLSILNFLFWKLQDKGAVGEQTSAPPGAHVRNIATLLDRISEEKYESKEEIGTGSSNWEQNREREQEQNIPRNTTLG